ncbi:MAG: methyltransferase domain-containing protein [Halioglobus sp.]|nr:methyltransferase domain-containing protein [Halioglobus sp.]
MSLSEFAKTEVLDFYRTLPFNVHGDYQQTINAIRSKNSVENYPCLVPLLSKGTEVLEVGCGAGWMSNCMAHYYGAKVTAIDFNEGVIAYAQSISDAMGLGARFFTSDLFLYSPRQRYDLVVSLGVLHHTGNCGEAIRRVSREFVKPDGYFLLGLYHKYGRRPFLKHFEDLRLAGASEADLFVEYKRLHSNLTDETHLRSWFRDQVLHPHETQHSLLEVSEVLESVNMEIVSTSINRFCDIDDMQDLFEQEKQLEAFSRDRLASGSYFPGFFVVLARRVGDG